MNKIASGLIHAHEAYSKAVLLPRLGISQKFWDKLLDEGRGAIRISEADLNEYLHSCRNQTTSVEKPHRTPRPKLKHLKL